MKRVLLIRTDSLAKIKPIVPPLGLMRLAASIRKWSPRNWEIRIADERFPYIGFKGIRKEIIDFKPDIIGLSTLTCESLQMHRIAKLTRDLTKGSKVIVGGPHATLFYKEILGDKNIDYAVIGEGEYTFKELLDSLKDGRSLKEVKGIAYRDNGRFILNERREFISNLDDIPYPAWDLIDIDAYSKSLNMHVYLTEKYYMPIFTSRACPFRCIFCHQIFGKGFRARSPENVFFEILTLYNDYGVREFHIYDDIFNWDKERAKRICGLIIESKIKIKIAFPNGLRGDFMDEELIYKLKKAGTYRIAYAVDTASPRLQKMMKKNLNLEEVKEAIALTDRAQIMTYGSFMLGFPTETKEEMLETIRFAKRSKLISAYFFQVVPYRGTELYEVAKRNYPKLEERINLYQIFSQESYYKDVTGVDPIKFQKMAYREFYSNPYRILRDSLLIFKNFLFKPVLFYKSLIRVVKIFYNIFSL